MPNRNSDPPDPLVATLAGIVRAIAEREAVDAVPVIATRSIERGRTDGRQRWLTRSGRRSSDARASTRQLSRGVVELRRVEAAWKASRRMIARGERPMYRVRAAGDGPAIRIQVVELPWLEARATRPGEVLRMGRAIVAEWLEVREGDFDVELASRE